MASYTGQAGTESVGTPTRHPVNRVGYGPAHITSKDLNTDPYLGSTSAVTQIGLYNDQLGTPTRSVVEGRPGAGMVELTQTESGTYRDTYDQKTIDFSASVRGLYNEQGDGGSVVPTAYFRRVTGVITDKQGNVIRNARYVVSLDNFGIVGEVDDSGVFEVYLLRQTYSDFMVVVDEGKKEGVDIVWYESEGTEVSVYDDSKQLTFDTSKTLSGGGGGLQVGGGVHLG